MNYEVNKNPELTEHIQSYFFCFSSKILKMRLFLIGEKISPIKKDKQ